MDGDDRTRAHPAFAPAVRAGELLHLDLLRFVASIGIVLTHSAEFLVPRAMRPSIGPAAGVLALFVDVFFVISGFVIAHMYAGRVGSPRAYGQFLQRRVARLIPLHLAVTVAWIALYAAIALGHVAVNHPMSLSPACVATTTLLLTAMVDCGGTPVGDANWSISAELGMYLLFPLFAAVIAGRAWRGLLLAGAGMLLAIWWRGGAIDLWQARLDITRALPAFPLGMALYAGRATLARLPMAQPALALAIAALVAGTLVPVPNMALLALAYAMPALAVAADLQGRGGARLRRWAPLGQLTYSVYMLHGLVIFVVLNALSDKLLKLPLPGMIMMTVATYAVLAVAAKLSFKWLEEPARAAINRVRLFEPRHTAEAARRV